MPLIDVEIWCSCGEGLCNQSEAVTAGRHQGIKVEPCEICLGASYDKGFKQGNDEALANQSDGGTQ